MSVKIDRRIKRSQQAIKTAFEEMLLDVGFDAITVKSITEKANIGRKTFYLHYVDKYDLLNSIVNEQLLDLESFCIKKKEKGLMGGTLFWFRYFEERRAFFTALFQADSTVSFRHRLLNFIMEQLDDIINREHCTSPEILRNFLGMAVLGTIEAFVLNQFEGDTEAVARQVSDLLEQILYSE